MGGLLTINPFSLCKKKGSLGAKDEVRTRDLNLGKVALYQLSYFRLLFVDANIAQFLTSRNIFLKKSQVTVIQQLQNQFPLVPPTQCILKQLILPFIRMFFFLIPGFRLQNTP